MKTAKSSMFLFGIIFTFLLITTAPLSYSQVKAITQTKELQDKTTPADALQMLKEGNNRFVENVMFQRNLPEQMHATAKGQYPFAIVLSCIDSRVAPEITFDEGLGDIFDARIAGNFVNDDILGSMEFACKVTGAKLILVMGHTNCGAIKGAIDDAQLGNITQMLTKIKPAVEKTSYDGEKSSKNYDYVDLVAKENVLLTVEEIKTKSPVLKEMLDKGEIDIVGCMYDLTTGKVEYYK
jgi:carbonic anhydrase